MYALSVGKCGNTQTTVCSQSLHLSVLSVYLAYDSYFSDSQSGPAAKQTGEIVAYSVKTVAISPLVVWMD